MSKSRSYQLAKKIYGRTGSDTQTYYDWVDAFMVFQDDRRVKGIEADYDYGHRRTEWTDECRELHEMNRRVMAKIAKDMREPGADVGDLYNVYSKCMLIEAPWDFDSFCLFLELDRPPREKFYQPRRKTMKRIADELQKLEDDELDELFLSQPARTGKSTLALFFVLFEIGKHPDRSNLYCTYSDTVARAFYNGLMEILTDDMTYNYRKIFPRSPVVQKNASDLTINMVRKTRYQSITCRSIDGTLNGAVDCDGILIGDDLCSGYEEAINTDRMMRLWGKVSNNLLPRAKQFAKKLWWGTSWSMLDPAHIEMDLLKNDSRFKDVRYTILNIPALDENDESNFDYQYGLGFSTEYYRRTRAGFEHNDDMASWLIQYQGIPVERQGSLFTAGECKFFNGELPAGEPDRVFMACDPAFGGGDFTAAPVCVEYGEDIYIVDVVYSQEDKTKTMPLLIDAIKKWHVELIQFEATKMLASYIDEFQAMLSKERLRCTVISKPAPTTQGNKHQRIQDKATDIRDHMIFLAGDVRPQHYQRFMDNVYAFKVYALKQHDDAPDSLAMAIAMVFRYNSPYARVFRRPF